MKFKLPWLCALSTLLALSAQAQSDERSGTVEIRAKAENLMGTASASSEGLVSAGRIAALPILRPGEVLEMVPGLIVTQHAGDGKANQYFLRGFNLDHGTDFATTVNGVPVNMPTHAHGQGYTDLNFLIPELVEQIAYKKGPYSASEGDFSAAGAARIDYLHTMQGHLADITGGAHGYRRMLLAGSPQSLNGQVLYGLEVFRNDGPWVVPENYQKYNGVLSYSDGTRTNGFNITGMLYKSQWTSTDQIPLRVVNQGALDRFGSLDPSTGGETHRYSLSSQWTQTTLDRQSKAKVWALQSALDLWSNFEYCMSSIQATGNCAASDQFKQAEQRKALGFGFSEARYNALNWGQNTYDTAMTWGLDGRTDRISPIGLYKTTQRKLTDTVREDRVIQNSIALWAQHETRWTSQFRSIVGARADFYQFDVQSNIAVNSGHAKDRQLSPKLNLIYTPQSNFEVYANYGTGFHSNDARGTTITVDPTDKTTAVTKVDPLVKAIGSELGFRTELVPGWHSSWALWKLNMASELLFIGDAGTTEPSAPSKRYGLEWNNFYALSSTSSLDFDVAWAHARFVNAQGPSSYIPGAVSATANIGLSVDNMGPWFGSIRFRYFGPRPLTEDGGIKSGATSLLNLRAGYKLSPQSKLSIDVYNLLNQKANDIEYAYASQLAQEASPVMDRHIHPIEPRMLRVTLTHRFQ
ncbi:MAG: TonB-dependent receptor [Pseudomonadota bacterium]|nr:TonB-dependent receptor [Pseudomonadota bacterium]